MRLLNITELSEGECLIISKNGDIYNAYFSERYNCLFCSIDSDISIAGYIQNVKQWHIKTFNCLCELEQFIKSNYAEIIKNPQWDIINGKWILEYYR